ncbi:MAG: hypothetical protein OXT67_13015 [Zetaproteobacteria bacterium]|nr:hypothetical protein [Zetaproteobacteria bacterium]
MFKIYTRIFLRLFTFSFLHLTANCFAEEHERNRPHKIIKPILKQQHKRLSKGLFEQLPEGLKYEMWLQIMADDPINAERVALTNTKTHEIFNSNRNKINPHRYQLLPQQTKWVEQAITAGIEGTEASHMLNFLSLEQHAVEKLLQKKEARLRTSMDWRKHGISLIAAWNAILQATESAALKAAGNAAGGAASDAFLETVEHIDLEEAEEEARRVAEEAAWTAVGDAAHSTAKSATENAVNSMIREVAEAAADEAINHTNWNEAVTLAENKAWDEAYEALSERELASHEALGTIAYRISETVSWLYILDPKLQVLEASYAAASNTLTNNDALLESCIWFQSAKALEETINAEFDHHNSEFGKDKNRVLLSAKDYHLRYKYVAFYLDNLRRIQTKVRQLKSLGR